MNIAKYCEILLSIIQRIISIDNNQKTIFQNQKMFLLTGNKVSPDDDLAQPIPNNELAPVQQLQTCRICLQPDCKLLAPCLCTGSIGKVHQKCLILWLQSQQARKVGRIICQICQQQIIYRTSIQYIWKPENCLQNISQINTCCLAILFMSLLCLIILAVVMRFGDEELTMGAARPVIIVVIAIDCLVLVCDIGYMVVFVLTEQVSRITAVLNRSQILRDSEYRTQTQQERLSSYIDSHSSIQYRPAEVR